MFKRYNERPHKEIRKLLRGPEPPDDFEGNGCTMSPDLWFREACRIHDWEYELIINLKQDTKEEKKECKRKRKKADKHLKMNIRTLSTCSVNKKGELVIKPPKWYYLYGYRLSRLYYICVRLFGSSFAK